MKLPAQWVNPTHTYRQVLRLVFAAIRLFRRLAGIMNTTMPFIAGAVTLNTQFRDLPQVGRNALLQFAQEREIDYSGLTATATLRQIIKLLADQLPTGQLNGIII
jgi:hypothetical protein